jgi:hypothetical protein
LIADLHAWLLATVRRLSKKSEMAGAIRYALTRWEALCHYRDDRGGLTFSDTGISGFLSGHDRREVHAKAET